MLTPSARRTENEGPRLKRYQAPACGRKVVIALLVFLGITALAGGVAMVLGLGSENTMLPDAWLERIPFINSWILPGIVLGVGFGLGALLMGYAVLRQPVWESLAPVERATGRHWAWVGTLLLGAGHVLWIALQLVSSPVCHGSR